MTKREKWTAQDDKDLLEFVEGETKRGAWAKDALSDYSILSGRTNSAVRNRYFKVVKTAGEEEETPLKVEPINNEVHPLLNTVSNYIKNLETENDELRETKEFLSRQNEELIIRVMELESCESELKQLVSIIDRSRKEAFAPDAGPKKYKVIDGVPVFEN